jgi:hypothetical protein
MRSAEDIANSKPTCRFVKLLSLDAITVAQQRARRGAPGKGFQQLPGSPFRPAMHSHSKMNWVSAVVRDNHQDEQNSERDRSNHEEVGRDQSLFVVLQKGAPMLRRRLPVPDPVFRYRCDTCRPSFNSSRAMRGAPQPGLARLIRPRSSATAPGTEGRPAGGRLFHLPYSRNPYRCQPMTVSGLTIIHAHRQSVHTLDSQTHNRRSVARKPWRWPLVERCRTKS